jgi:hypothetical protein
MSSSVTLIVFVFALLILLLSLGVGTIWYLFSARDVLESCLCTATEVAEVAPY